ncbi:MAG: hypothetical protein ABJH82_02405 [Polaribacter sp.]|uniref:hypothetical protein n=1 Tax=Polaribacter sp. TaxID=1920175 RepID=UPI003264421D
MKKRILKTLILLLFVFIFSCEKESTCQTKKQCYSDGNGGQTCVEVPIPRTCINNSFGI